MFKRKCILASLTLTAFLGLSSYMQNSDAYYITKNTTNEKAIKPDVYEEYKNARNIRIDFASNTGESAKDKNIRLASILAKRLESHPDSIDVSDIYFESGASYKNYDIFAKNVISYLEYANPDMYAFRGNCSIKYNPYTKKVFLTNIHYEITLDEHKRVVDKVDEIVAKIPKKLDDASKVLWVNNYLVTHAQYDTEAANSLNSNPRLLETTYRHAFTPYGVLIQNKGVCESYAKAFSMIMKRLNIPNYRVRSEAMKHTWNIVKIGQNWYNIDVTWNDPVGIAKDEISYAFFLKSDQGMMKNSSSSSPHYSSDEKIENTDSTDRDFNPFGLSTVKDPLFINNKFIYINKLPFSNYDKTVGIKEYKANKNELMTIFKRAEGFRLNHNNHTYVFNFNKKDKVLEMFDLENPTKPISVSSKLDDFKTIATSYYSDDNDSNGINNYIISNASIDKDKINIDLLKTSNNWGISYTTKKNITMDYNSEDKPEDSSKPEDNNSENKPENSSKPEDNNSENKPEDNSKPEDNNSENKPEDSSKPEDNNSENKPEDSSKPEDNNSENKPEDSSKPEDNNSENKPEDSSKPEDNNSENKPEDNIGEEDENNIDSSIKEYIDREKNINNLINLYNRSFDINVRNAVMNRFKALNEEYSRDFFDTYDASIGNKVLTLRSILKLDNSDVYSAHNNYKNYVNAYNRYSYVVRNYYNRILRYQDVTTAYNNLVNMYSHLSESYKAKNPLKPIIKNISNEYVGVENLFGIFGNRGNFRFNTWF